MFCYPSHGNCSQYVKHCWHQSGNSIYEKNGVMVLTSTFIFFRILFLTSQNWQTRAVNDSFYSKVYEKEKSLCVLLLRLTKKKEKKLPNPRKYTAAAVNASDVHLSPRGRHHPGMCGVLYGRSRPKWDVNVGQNRLFRAMDSRKNVYLAFVDYFWCYHYI